MATSSRQAEAEVLRAALGFTPACPAVEELERGVAGAQSHLGACPHCEAQFALLGGFDDASPRPHERRPVRWIVGQLESRFSRVAAAPPMRAPWWRRLIAPVPMPAVAGAAALVLIVAGAGTYLSRPGEPALPRSVRTGVLRSAQVAIVAPMGDLSSPPAQLSWAAVPGASRYEVRVMAVDRAELWKTEVAGTATPLPPGLAATGRPLLWQVVARDGAGRQMAASETARFRVWRR